MATKRLQKLQRHHKKLGIRGICGRKAYFQCGFSREIKVVKSSGNNNDPRLTSARKPFIFKGLRVCYILPIRFCNSFATRFPEKCFATDGIVPGGFVVRAVFEAFIMVYCCLVLIFAPGYSSGPPPARCPAKRIVPRTAAIPPPAGSVHQWRRAFSCFL